jgi:hypothetical protein
MESGSSELLRPSVTPSAGHRIRRTFEAEDATTCKRLTKSSSNLL